MLALERGPLLAAASATTAGLAWGQPQQLRPPQDERGALGTRLGLGSGEALC